MIISPDQEVSDNECDSETEDTDQGQADHETEDSGGVAAWFDMNISTEQGNHDDQEVIVSSQFLCICQKTVASVAIFKL